MSNNDIAKRFGQGAHGVTWALTQIPGSAVDGKEARLGRRRLILKPAKTSTGDSYAIAWSPHAVTITATSAVGTIGGLLEVARQVNEDVTHNVTQQIAFKTRFYKHEVQWDAKATRTKGAHAGATRPITKYTERFVEAFFQQIVSRHFNAVVVYAGYHPFEYFLDYKGFAHGTDKSSAMRRRNFQALSRFLGMAKQYGLRTFLHHYVSHFTQALADHLKLGLSETGMRLAGFDHPVIEQYNRYIYRRTFQILPELDGLFMNFESTGNAVPFMEKTLLRVANNMARQPELFFRLWGVSDVDGMVGLLRHYKGPKGLVHKSHETNDVYYYPVANERIKTWKAAMPDVEFAFSLGPCHNCGTNISRKLWTDPDYLHALLKDIQDQGADSISFQSTRELLLWRLPDAEFFPQAERDHSRMNFGHLEAVVDYVRGRRPSTGTWTRRHAQWFGTTDKAGRAIRQAITQSSQIILKQYRQFAYGSSQEGYLYPGRFSHYQEPFFYYPMSFFNRLGEIPHNVSWRSWTVRTKPVKVVPNDTQAIIDFVNPKITLKPANHPLALARQIRRHIAGSKAAVARYQKLAPGKTDQALIAQVLRNCNNGERIWREIMIGVELYSCYFAASKAAFFKHIANARNLMLQSVKVLGKNIADTDQYCSTTASGPYRPAQDAAQLETILSYRPERVPFQALGAYLQSRERYNEIRRLCRPYVSVREQMSKRNLRLLRQSLRAAERATALLDDDRYALYRDNVMAWVQYLQAEIDWLTPPAMTCPSDDSVPAHAGFRNMVHDHAYRWGQPCWEDFASFFRRYNFFGQDHCDCRATYTGKGLKLSLREHGINWRQRKTTWDKNRGTVNQIGFMRIFIDPQNTGNRIINYNVYFQGQGGTVRQFVEYPNGHIHADPPKPWRDCRTTFAHTDSSWRCDVTIPWAQLGGKPKHSDLWRLNILSNPSVIRNRQVAWCQGYEYRDDIARLGPIVFV